VGQVGEGEGRRGWQGVRREGLEHWYGQKPTLDRKSMPLEGNWTKWRKNWGYCQPEVLKQLTSTSKPKKNGWKQSRWYYYGLGTKGGQKKTKWLIEATGLNDHLMGGKCWENSNANPKSRGVHQKNKVKKELFV